MGMHGPQLLEICCRSVQTHVDEDLGSPAKQKRDILPQHQHQYEINTTTITTMPSADSASSLPGCQAAIVVRGPGKLAIQHGAPAYDFACTIIAPGADAMTSGRFAVGDRVVGMVYGMNKLQPNVGAVAEYMGSCADLLVKVFNSIGFEEAACLGSRLLRQLWAFLLSCVYPHPLNVFLHLQVLMERRRICRSGIYPNSRGGDHLHAYARYSLALKTTSQASSCPALHQTCMHRRRANAKWT